MNVHILIPQTQMQPNNQTSEHGLIILYDVIKRIGINSLQTHLYICTRLGERGRIGTSYLLIDSHHIICCRPVMHANHSIL